MVKHHESSTSAGPVSLVAMARKRRPDTTHSATHDRPEDAYGGVPVLQEPVWNHEITLYFFFGGISAGAFTLGALASTVGGKQTASWAASARLVAAVALMPCPALLIDDLGRPERFLHMLRVFKPESPMNLGAWVLSIHTGFTIADFVGHWHVLKRVSLLRPFVTSSSLKLAAIAGVPPALALGGYTGVLLGQTSTPAWSHSPVLGGLFGVSALSSGAAAVEFVEAMRSADSAPAGIRAVCAVLSGMELLGVVAYLGSSGQAARAFWRSKPGMLLACSTVSTLAGIGFDALGHRMSQPRAARALGGLATLTGGLLLRAAVVQAGKVSARDRDLQL